MPQEKRPWRLPLCIALRERGQRHTQTVVTDESAEGREDGAIELHIGQPQSAWIVAVEKRKRAIQRAGVGIEDIRNAHCGELLRLLLEEGLEHGQLLFARLGPAIFEPSHFGEPVFLSLQRRSMRPDRSH